MIMARRVRIATTSLATLEDTAPPYNLRHADTAANLELGLALLDAAGAQGVDLACLPEAFVAAGLPAERWAALAEALPGPTFATLAERARRYSMYVVAGLLVADGGRLYNDAVLIDRNGQLAGTYAKQHPTEGEIDCGITPGSESKVFDTDFGRLGLAICFDINWPAMWDELARQGARLVTWISAYEGGLPLQTLAWQHHYPVVTSVWPYHARIIDATGRIVASSSRWGRLAIGELDLGQRIFHTDGQAQHILGIQRRYGSRVRVGSLTEEHLFTLESNDPDLTPDQVAAEFGLVDYETYIARCSAVQDQARRG
jgi:predicted amidohydrolase